MMKPAEVSDSENIEDSEVPKGKSKEGAEAPKEGEADSKEEAAKVDEVKDKDKKMEDEAAALALAGTLPTALKKVDKTKSEI